MFGGWRHEDGAGWTAPHVCEQLMERLLLLPTDGVKLLNRDVTGLSER